ncbi:hypothetical protein Q1695_005088 [Nippostrongylus brasiliensis]|nr:hypothetical protein Q1695_005088 [Nippostrongylus brasiliensis]
MLLFSQQELGSYAQELQSKARDVLFGVRHLRIATACLLLCFWLVWIVVTAEFLFTFTVWPVEKCWNSVECAIFSLIVTFHAVMLLLGTVGWICTLPILTTFLIVPPLCFGGAVSGMLISYWNDSEAKNSNAGISRPMLVVIACLWIFIIYAVIIIERYCDYSKSLKLLQRRIGVNVEVFKERVFGTPPLKEFHRMEHPRCSQMSDSLLENIFDDYEPEPALY